MLEEKRESFDAQELEQSVKIVFDALIFRKIVLAMLIELICAKERIFRSLGSQIVA